LPPRHRRRRALAGWMNAESMPHAIMAYQGPRPQVEALCRAESTPYIGRAVVASARNGRVMGKSGWTLVVGELACVYGLTRRRRPAEPPPFRVSPTAQG
jgi:hypothetical protein